MKEFKISIGLAEDSMVEVIHASLKDDAQPETFSLRSTDKSGISVPSRFVRVEPLSYVTYDHWCIDGYLLS